MEISAYLRFSHYVRESDRERLGDQLRRVSVLSESQEHATFSELKDAVLIEGLPDTLTVFYDDEDGATVHMMPCVCPRRHHLLGRSVLGGRPSGPKPGTRCKCDSFLNREGLMILRVNARPRRADVGVVLIDRR